MSRLRERIFGWMDDLQFYVLSTIFQSYHDDGRMIRKAVCNEPPFSVGKILTSSGARNRSVRSVSQRLTH